MSGEFFMLNESVIKLLKNGMWDLATCSNGEPNVVPILQNICKWSNIFYKEDEENKMLHCQKCDYRN